MEYPEGVLHTLYLTQHGGRDKERRETDTDNGKVDLKRKSDYNEADSTL
jgi:hypothetical protein